MRHEESVGVGGLTTTFALLAVVSMAAPSARAQDGFLELPDDPSGAACFVFAALIDAGNELCSEVGCDPTEKDCEKLCKNASKTCKAIGGSTQKLVKDAVKGASKELKILCKGADDPKDCKSAVKIVDKDVKNALKQFKKDMSDACKDEDLVSECDDACNEGLDGDELVCDGP